MPTDLPDFEDITLKALNEIVAQEGNSEPARPRLGAGGHCGVMDDDDVGQRAPAPFRDVRRGVACHCRRKGRGSHAQA